MSTFPKLKTGAVTQYPTERSSSFSTHVVRFLDGSEQRFRETVTALKRWAIRLEALDESELNAVREFFRIQDGAAGSFHFVDPWDGTEYSDCSLEMEELVEISMDDSHGRTTVSVKENRR